MEKQMDFNDANPQRVFDVIPAGTVATLHMTVRPGNAGEGGLLRRSKDGNSEALDCEFTVVDGPYAKRKVWGLFTLVGATPNHATAAEISRSRLRAILESARGIRPDDMSEAAKQARQVPGYQDFDASASSAASVSSPRATTTRPRISCSTPSPRTARTGTALSKLRSRRARQRRRPLPRLSRPRS
jgi:hypothetical protein